MKIFKSFYFHIFIYSLLQTKLLILGTEHIATKVLYWGTLYLFYMFLSQVNRSLFRIGVLFSLLMTILIYPMLETYGYLSFAFVVSLYHTDLAESLSYIKTIPYKIYIVLSLFTVYTIYLMRLYYEKIKLGYLKYALGLALIILPIKKYATYGWQWEVGRFDRLFNFLPLKYSANFVNMWYNVGKEYSDIIEKSKEKDTWQIENLADIELKDFFVIVVGESVRRDFMHNYGFEIENTPFIDKSNPIQFNNFISIAPNTINSIARTLAMVEPNDIKNRMINNNIVNLSKKMGYYTYWLSNQGIEGEYDSEIAIIGNYSDKTRFIKERGITHITWSDMDLLSVLDDAISEKTEKPKFVVLHMLGSHSYVCDRTKGKYDEFIISKEISCYNKSIKNLDLFLENVHHKLSKTGKSFTMVYFSDHGQVIRDDGGIRHVLGYKEQYEVPLLVWSSDENIVGGGNGLIINSLRKSSDFLYLFGELHKARIKSIKRDYKFISEDNYNDDRVVGGNNEILRYNELKPNPIKDFLNK